MRKILFPTDFSETSLNAFVYALQLAKHIHAEIITLHVYQLPILDSNYMDVPIYLTQIYENIDLSNFENFKDQIPLLRTIAQEHQLEHIKTSNVLLDGDLVNNVLKIVEEQNIEYVVMGTQGASGLKEMLLGSSTASIMNGTKAFVLGIPEGSRYEPIKRIAFATKFTNEDAIALKKLIEIAHRFDAHIDCVHIKTSNTEDNDLAARQWAAQFSGQNVDHHSIENKEIEEAIIDFIEIHKINMLAMLNHNRGFFERLFHTSLTKKLAFHLNIPLLALHNG